MYCDENRICRCRPEYPVQVGIHSCAKSKKHDEYCSYNEQCNYHDNNSFCTQNTYSSYCECLDGFAYDKMIELCIPGQYNLIDKSCIYAFFLLYICTGKGEKHNHLPIIPTAAGFLVASFSLLCCCVLVWHNFCRVDDPPQRNHQRSHRSHHHHYGDNLNRVNRINNQISENSFIALPSYEFASNIHDEPPPKYEDVIKEAQEEAQKELSNTNQDNQEVKV